MANRQLTQNELKRLFRPLYKHVANRLKKISGRNTHLYWSLRRKLYKEFMYQERGKPMHRKQLKTKKRKQQKGLCDICKRKLPEKNVVLDRLKAMNGYTEKNTRLLCRDCDYKIQVKRRFK